MNSEKQKLKVVFDTNIYISAVLFGGNPGKAYHQSIKDNFILYVSSNILAEIEKCLVGKFCWESSEAHAFTNQIRRIARELSIIELVHEVCRDPKDDHVLSLAYQVTADYIVSGDKDLLSLKSYGNIKIITANSFLKI